MESKSSYVAFDRDTRVVWGIGDNAEEAMKEAKFAFSNDTEPGVGYEFACWCSDLEVKACTSELKEKVKNSGRLSVTEDFLVQNTD